MEDFTIDINEEKIYNTEGKKESSGIVDDFPEATKTSDGAEQAIRNINYIFYKDYEEYDTGERYFRIQRREIDEIITELFEKLVAYRKEEEERKKLKVKCKKEILCFYDAADAANAYPKKDYFLIFSLKKHLKEEEIIAAGNKYYDLPFFEKLSRARSSVAIKPTMKDGLFCHTLPEEIFTEKKQEKTDYKKKKNKRF